MKSSFKKSKRPYQSKEPLDLNAFFLPEQTRDKLLFAAASYRKPPYRLVEGNQYKCCEYRIWLNIFSFGKANIKLPFTVIGPPASFDQVGFYGNLDRLMEEYAKRKGNFLVLNLTQPYEGGGVMAKTLSTAIFKNRFADFESYVSALRSHYRRRLQLAKDKISGMEWTHIESKDFDESMYKLYIQVLSHSGFPLETLGIEFFRTYPAKIFVLWEGCRPYAFVMVEHTSTTTSFLLGGMDYVKRDANDLYYNMLIKVLEEGISHGSECIHFGQTAEHSKCRLGCTLIPRYMLFFTSNRLMMVLAKKLIKFIEYRDPPQTYHVFKAKI